MTPANRFDGLRIHSFFVYRNGMQGASHALGQLLEAVSSGVASVVFANNLAIGGIYS
jgi:hypothetical protein